MEKEIYEFLQHRNKILERMKSDYGSLVEEEIVIRYERNAIKPYLDMKKEAKTRIFKILYFFFIKITIHSHLEIIK